MDKPSITALVFAMLLAPAFLRAQDAARPSPSAIPSTAALSAAPPAAAAATPPVIAGGNFPVVQPQRLIALLPVPPTGWSADKPEGSNSESGGFQITTVSCTYVKGDADDAPTATISIIDSANNQQFQEATKAMWSATDSSPQGYDKTVTVAGLPGFEHFANSDQTGVLWVVAAGRFFVQVETTHQPASELEGWLARLDLKKLSVVK